MESRVPRFAAEAHLDELFGDEGAPETDEGYETSEPYAESDLDALPAAAEIAGFGPRTQVGATGSPGKASPTEPSCATATGGGATTS
jgi:hypothetical protein